MRSRLLGVIAAGAVLAAVGGLAPANATSVQRAARGTGSAGAPLSTQTVLVNRIGNPGTYSILSQTFTDSGFDIYDSQLADDFAVPSTLTKGWIVKGMRAVGIFFNGSGVCDSETVTIYNDAAGLPGSVVATRTGAGTLSGSATYTLPINPAIKLQKGKTYWASMVCTMAFSVGGEWGWSTRIDQSGNTAKWQNPGGGFGVCPTWADMDTCTGITGEPDVQFALVGDAQ
jgi:hypothetical protein